MNLSVKNSMSALWQQWQKDQKVRFLNGETFKFMQMVNAGQKEVGILSTFPLTDVKIAPLPSGSSSRIKPAPKCIFLVRFCSQHFRRSPRWSSVHLDIVQYIVPKQFLFDRSPCLGVIFWHCILVYIIHNINNPSDNPTFDELRHVPAFPCTGGHMPPQNTVWHVTVGGKIIHCS